MKRKKVTLRVVRSSHHAHTAIHTRYAASITGAIINAALGGKRRRGLIVSPCVSGPGVYDVLQRVDAYTDEIVARVAVYEVR